MCGIAGYLNLDGAPADKSVLEAMCDAIVHRGPDSQGILVDGPVALGMRRLAIIDVEGGSQPMTSPDGSKTIVFNGECYNFQTERKRLADSGVKFETNCDTEVVLSLYDEKKDDCLDDLRGMYAFAIWDRADRSLFLARDRIGKKPLHFYQDGQTFFFASEIKSILVGLSRLRRARPAVDESAVVRYMGYGYIPDPKTIFKGMEKLPPANTLTLKDGRRSLRRYWQVDYTPDESLDEKEHFERLESILEESVRLRMISDVPLGAYLSGGVDSSTVVGLMCRVANAPVKTFSIGFEDQAFDELPYARRVAKHLGTDHHEEIVRPNAAEIIEDLVRQFDEPFADSSAIPTYYVSKMARKHVTVALSGDGGDELFCGYARYAKTSSGALDFLPLGLRRMLFGLAAKAMPIGAFGQASFQSIANSAEQRYIQHLTCGVSDWHTNLFDRDFGLRAGGTDPSDCFADIMKRHQGLSSTRQKMIADAEVYLPADIMTKVDRMSMLVSLEARAPMLDHKFVEAAAKVPLRFSFADGEGKLILKKLARNLVPADVIDRKKQGFAIPISNWFQNEWNDRAEDLVLGKKARERGIFNPVAVDRLWREHHSQRRDQSHLLWCLMVLEMWHRLFVDESAFSQ
ncbi:MAG: asparagine synthase (glutamine-hydrolyzing) [Planctomycetota bacterium]|jgi:asparagine synthase (glutamine-hydrolysing)